MLSSGFRQRSYFNMTLLIILGVVFAGVALMVFFGERHAKPMEPETQQKLSRVITILIGVLIVALLIKNLM